VACTIRAICTDETETAYEGWTPAIHFVHESEFGQSLTSERFATQYADAGHAGAVASEFDGRLIAKYGRRVYDFEVVSI
jgi:hypothetical protein